MGDAEDRQRRGDRSIGSQADEQDDSPAASRTAPLELTVVVRLEARLAHQLVVQRRPHWNSLSLGLARSVFWSSSIASRSRFVSFFGTSMRRRASTSPRPEPPSFGAPRPRMRRSLPSSEPAGTFSETGPSGVGTSTMAPSAASE